ncbi:MAG: Glutamate/gamma-aminobutyrate antiporter [Chlamydiia bacterium]|nr:Glutamate/gamma-aminobutyrate antiporter [Chlamydiia bacterium]
MEPPSSSNPKRVISVFVLAMFNVSIMASLRNLPLVAEYGYSAIIYFAIVGLFFLIPLALVSAELATGWPKSGGIYIWVREAFGDKAGFFAIWMQWVHNVTWYPAILSFVATTLAYVFFPPIAEHPLYVLLVVLVAFWGMTFLNFMGIKTSSLASTIGVIGGTIVPGCFLIGLGFTWVSMGNPVEITLSKAAISQNFSSINDVVFLGGLFLAFAGLEVSAGYAGEVKDPQKNYPRAIIIAALIVFFLFMLGSLSIAMVIPKENISLVAGLIEALKIFLVKFHIEWMLPILAFLLVVGSIAEVNSWIIGPVKALHTTSNHGNLPPIFQKTNEHGMPTNILIFQAIIVSIATFVFILMPNLSSAYWILSALSTQIYLVMYILMFAAAIRLRYTSPHVPRAYQIPHPHKGIWVVAFIGMIASLFGIILVFIPPAQLHIGSLLFYESFLMIGLAAMIALPLIIHAFKKPEWDLYPRLDIDSDRPWPRHQSNAP